MNNDYNNDIGDIGIIIAIAVGFVMGFLAI